MSQPRFAGFSPDLAGFLTELSTNNNRQWFEANKQRYEDQVRGPALDFIEAFSVPLMDFAPCFVAMPKKVGGSMMRPYRDVRFSKDKTPYKTNVGIQFRHELGRDVHAPGYYVHIDPEQVFLAAGIWRPDSDTLGKIRDRIVTKAADWTRVIENSRFKKRFQLSGTSLTRPPRGYDKAHEHIEDLKRKDFIAVCTFTHDDLYGPTFLKTTERAFRTAEPLMHFLCKSANVSF